MCKKEDREKERGKKIEGRGKRVEKEGKEVEKEGVSSSYR